MTLLWVMLVLNVFVFSKTKGQENRFSIIELGMLYQFLLNRSRDSFKYFSLSIIVSDLAIHIYVVGKLTLYLTTVSFKKKLILYLYLQRTLASPEQVLPISLHFITSQYINLLQEAFNAFVVHLLLNRPCIRNKGDACFTRTMFVLAEFSVYNVEFVTKTVLIFVWVVKQRSVSIQLEQMSDLERNRGKGILP